MMTAQGESVLVTKSSGIQQLLNVKCLSATKDFTPIFIFVVFDFLEGTFWVLVCQKPSMKILHSAELALTLCPCRGI